MRPIVWKNPNKQDIHSGHATWDAQVTALMPGNVVGGGYLGSYIRPRQTPFYPDNRTPAAPGQMRTFDLGHFDYFGIPPEVRAFVEQATETEYALLYVLYHTSGRENVVHGWIVTRGTVSGAVDRDDPRNYRLLRCFVTGPTSKSADVVATAVEYLSNPA